MRTKHILPAFVALGLATGSALAAGGESHIENVAFSFEGPFGTYDEAQLQRGFQVYKEVCSACHGLKYVTFRALGEHGGLGYDEALVKAFAAEFEVPDEEGEPGDTRAGKPFDHFPENTGAGAPDLSLMAKARAGFHGPMGLGLSQLFNGTGGPEYIYSILTGYTGEEIEQAGAVLYENTAMPGGMISMSPPLSEGAVEYQDGKEATVEQMAEDVSAFLMWAAEPKMTERKVAGARNVFFLIVLTILLYLTNKKIWANVKKRKSA
jgi:ubiquinol-cytochrome c reductase cytochrome c1 subunit